jgi:hypothetical protein
MSSRTHRARRPIASVAALALAVTGLAGCDSSYDPSTTPPASIEASAPATPGLPAPIIVEPGQTEATASVGETIVFNLTDPAQAQVSTDRTDILELTQGADDGSAQFNPAARALAPGVAVVTIVAADGSTSTVTVTVG